MLYHVPGSRNYGATVAEVYFATAEDAESAGWHLGEFDCVDDLAIDADRELALGDAGMAVFAFWMVSVRVRTRSWALKPTRSEVMGFVAVGVLLTVVFEWLATSILSRWTYAGSMPTLPFLGTGLLPLLQWDPPATAYPLAHGQAVDVTPV